MPRHPIAYRPIHRKLRDLRWNRYVRERAAKLEADGWTVEWSDDGDGFYATKLDAQVEPEPFRLSDWLLDWFGRLFGC